MRIALVAPSLDILGGQGVQAQMLAERLAGEGYDVDFIPVNPRFPAGLRWVRRLRFVRTALNQALYLASLRRVRRCEVVHVFAAAYWSFLLAAAPAIFAGKRLGKRVVLNYHSGEADDHLSHWGKRVHPGLRAADEIVVPSEYLRAVFARHGYRARVVRNALDLSRFTYRERRLLRPRLLSTRNLESHYGVDTTIEAFAMLKRRYPEATLTVAGAGSEERRLRALARARCEGGVRFLGRVEPSAIPALYESCDIYVNSSVIDNQPLSLLEAFAAGLPVVSTPTGDIGAMVRGGEMGVLVPPGDPSCIAGAVESLLDRPGLALQLAHRARQRVEAYAWLSVRDGWAAVYEGKA